MMEGTTAGTMGRRLEELRLKLNQARNLNTKEVEEDVKRSAFDAKEETKKKRVAERRADKEKQKLLKAGGAVFVERRDIEESAAVLEVRAERKSRKRSAPEGEIIFGEDHLREAFERRTQNVPNYQAGEVVDREVNDLEYGKTTAIAKENVDNMVSELESTIERREKFSRRRAFLEDEIDVDFINERNRKFNKKISRAFDEYTSDIKQSLERGTALP